MISSDEAFAILKTWQEEPVPIDFLRLEPDSGPMKLGTAAPVRIKEIFPSDLVAILTVLGSNTAIAVHFSPDSFNRKTALDGTFATVMLHICESILEAKLCDGTSILFLERKRPN